MALRDHLLSTIWLYAQDGETLKGFYRDVLGLDLFDEHGGTAHFDAGGVRLSLHPRDGAKAWGFLVFLVEEGIEAVCQELRDRGLSFEEELHEAEFGTAASFRDPEGNLLFLWQPPPPDDDRYGMVAPLVDHHRRVAERLRGGPASRDGP